MHTPHTTCTNQTETHTANTAHAHTHSGHTPGPEAAPVAAALAPAAPVQTTDKRAQLTLMHITRPLVKFIHTYS